MKYRLYIDEVGNSDMNASLNPVHQYLSLTGVIFELGYVESMVFPAVEALKRKYFDSHPDEPVILHRKGIVQKNFPFVSLRDPAIASAFNTELLALLDGLEYVVVTAVIDKIEHQQRYQTWRFDPYHYCLTVIVERFLLWLRAHRARGDVMAESRGGAEDRRLKDVFRDIYDSGTEFVHPQLAQTRLTSSDLKVKAKDSNVAGLQLADLIAHPSFQATKALHGGGPMPSNFGGLIAAILEKSKYHRSPDGEIEGYGRKWLP